MFYSDDPARDAEAYMKAMDERQARRPVCCKCDRHINDNMALHLVLYKNEIWVCQDCIEDNMELIEE